MLTHLHCARFPSFVIPIFSGVPVLPTTVLSAWYLPSLSSFLSSVSTMLHRADLWHALAPSLPHPDLDGLLLPVSILLVGPNDLLLQIAPGTSHATGLEDLACAKLGAEIVEGEALTALLLLKDWVGQVIVLVHLIHAIIQHATEQSGNLVNIRLHLWHQPPEPAFGGETKSDKLRGHPRLFKGTQNP